jgi:hypothetical protein
MLRPDLERLLGSTGAGQAVCAARREIWPMTITRGSSYRLLIIGLIRTIRGIDRERGPKA